ncbi:transcription termination/antitermination NusG family protein [Marivita sp.]|uniref:transcription termination/antitermination protein NusG n=1 Tax=Marivita sp. TaxID=2003365 RepID=UPI00321A4ACF
MAQGEPRLHPSKQTVPRPFKPPFGKLESEITQDGNPECPRTLKRAEENLTRQGFESFCPKRLESRLQGGRRISKQTPLFPGYLFVSVRTQANCWKAINATRDVSRLLITDPRMPVPLPHEFMAGLMARCDEHGLIGPPTDLDVGDTVRVVSGAFADTIAKIETLQDGERLQILMELMGQKARVSVSQHSVERL